MGHSTVMLSTFAPLSVNSAKHLEAHAARPFATLRVTRRGRPRSLESWTCVFGWCISAPVCRPLADFPLSRWIHLTALWRPC